MSSSRSAQPHPHNQTRNHHHSTSSSSTRAHSQRSSTSALDAHTSHTRPSTSTYWQTVLDPLSVPSAADHTGYSAGSSSTTAASLPPSPAPAHPVEKPFICDQCGTAFKKNSNLVKHLKLVHLGERNFACTEPGCGRLFGQKSNLNSHVKAVHLGEKPFICPEANCGRRFSQKSGLKAHIKTVHNGERPYVCECGSSFGHRGDLNRHIRVLHERQRPFECPICPEQRAFGRKSVLMRHMLTHSQPGAADMPVDP